MATVRNYWSKYRWNDPIIEKTISECDICRFLIKKLGKVYYIEKNLEEYSGIRVSVNHNYLKEKIGVTESHLHLIDLNFIEKCKEIPYEELSISVRIFLDGATRRLKAYSGYTPLYANEFPEEITQIEPRPK